MFVVSGKLSDKSLIKSGVSEKGAWRVIVFLIEKTRKRKPIKIPIVAKGKLAEKIDGIMVGEKLTVRFFIEGKKFNDRYYTDCIAIEIEKYTPKAKYQYGQVMVNDQVFQEGSEEFLPDSHLFTEIESKDGESE